VVSSWRDRHRATPWIWLVVNAFAGVDTGVDGAQQRGQGVDRPGPFGADLLARHDPVKTAP